MSDKPARPDPGVAKTAANDDQMEKIDAIVGEEALGYEGSARGEHSGQNAGRGKRADGDLEDRLADNRPDQVK